jgi:hypothetical protein
MKPIYKSNANLQIANKNRAWMKMSVGATPSVEEERSDGKTLSVSEEHGPK